MRKSPVYYVNGRMAKYLDSYLQEHPVDVLVMPHLYPAETITYMKSKGMKLPLTVAIMTDYTLSLIHILVMAVRISFHRKSRGRAWPFSTARVISSFPAPI